LPGTDVDYNLGYVMPGSSCHYAALNGVSYNTLADWRAALATAGFLGCEAHGVSADPLFTSLAAEDVTLLPGSPAIDAGAIIGYPGEMYLGAAPDLGIYSCA
jgi:hypothetical protein